MTSRPSSTSSSDARRYLRVLAVALATLVGALVAITATGYRLGLVEAANRDILDYQLDKLAAAVPIDVAFVGDSSLGNAIDARSFGTLAGAATVNLALNGSYGSGGAYNMARRLLERHAPKLIVVMQSIDTPRRDDAFAGFYFSAEPRDLLTTSPIRMLELYFSLKTAKRVVEQLWAHGFAVTPTRFDGDYIAQSNRPLRRTPEAEVAANPLQPGMIAPAQLGYLERLAQLCAERGVACLYAHGPIFDGYCRQAGDYVAALNAEIRNAGLEVVAGTPSCIGADEVGDSIDHVRRDLKAEYTRRYHEALRSALDRSLGRE